MRIRSAHFGDEEHIAMMPVHSWQCTYHRFDPEDKLQDLNAEDRRQEWLSALQDVEKNPATKTIFIAEDQGRVIGFIAGGATRTAGKTGFDAELYALYVMTGQQNKGVGAELFGALANWLIANGFNDLFVWAFADNPFLPFYIKMGGVMGKESRINTSLGVPLKIIDYTWCNLQKAESFYG